MTDIERAVAAWEQGNRSRWLFASASFAVVGHGGVDALAERIRQSPDTVWSHARAWELYTTLTKPDAESYREGVMMSHWIAVANAWKRGYEPISLRESEDFLSDCLTQKLSVVTLRSRLARESAGGFWEWAQKLRSSMEKNIVFAPRGADGESEQKVADAGRAFCEMVKDYAP